MMDMSLEGEMALGGENMRDVSGQRFVDIKSWAKEGLVILNRGDEDSTFKARFTDISLKGNNLLNKEYLIKHIMEYTPKMFNSR